MMRRERVSLCGGDATSLLGERGFTLIELLVVMLILGLVATLSGILVIRGVKENRPVDFERKFVRTLRMARLTAINKGEPVPFVIDANTRSFRIDDEKGVSIPEEAEIKGDGLLEGKEGESVILFYPDGSSSSAELTLVWGDRSWRISVGILGKVEEEKASP